jgi:hypothetical protein
MKHNTAYIMDTIPSSNRGYISFNAVPAHEKILQRDCLMNEFEKWETKCSTEALCALLSQSIISHRKREHVDWIGH